MREATISGPVMRCPKCGCKEDKVVDSRSSRDGAAIRRRRRCGRCDFRFTTYEEIRDEAVMVIKRDGRRERFSKDKLARGIEKACEKRPISAAEIEEIVGSVVNQVYQQYELEVPYQRLGELVMNELQLTDKIAYIRYASIYRRFEEISEFISEVERLERRKNDPATLQLPGM